MKKILALTIICAGLINSEGLCSNIPQTQSAPALRDRCVHVRDMTTTGNAEPYTCPTDTFRAGMNLQTCQLRIRVELTPAQRYALELIQQHPAIPRGETNPAGAFAVAQDIQDQVRRQHHVDVDAFLLVDLLKFSPSERLIEYYTQTCKQAAYVTNRTRRLPAYITAYTGALLAEAERALIDSDFLNKLTTTDSHGLKILAREARRLLETALGHTWWTNWTTLSLLQQLAEAAGIHLPTPGRNTP